ncbi:hemicentin-2 isoform X1 [Rhipicephalus sanguineus]|uniref:hemicentin-2 isoform X1 n=1 Tax=Rhipicephalus sanguineus TaxID=34632 RepID=UPI0018936D3D|nr:hemicentin-2 isoform X1 [Rhipicephalus sanguineus]
MSTSFLCSWTVLAAGAAMRLLFHVHISAASSEGIIGREHNVTGFVGGSAVLPCEVDEASCGRVYFITWTKNVSQDWQRVYLFSETVNRVMGPLSEPHRATFQPGNASAHLRIQPLTVEDEGTYKCDVTYVQGKCPSLSFTRLQTLVTPKEPVIKMDGRRLTNGSLLGPYLEGTTVVLDCFSSGGRPAPQVLWRNASAQLPVKTSVTPHLRGIHDVTSTARFVLSRWDLGARLECVVITKATPAPVVKWVQLDVHVRPLALRLRGPNHPVVAGEMVSLTCIVEGARPAANITWYNRSELVRPQPPAAEDLMSDGTYRTASTLVFVASLYDHQAEFFCKGTNQVLKNRTEAPLLQAVRLEVLYPPAVRVLPAEGVNVTEWHSCNLTCHYDANPPNATEVAWYKNGELLPPRTRGHRLLPKTVLLIRNATRKDAGVYSCHVKNAFGRGNASNSVYLDVFYTPLVSVWVNPSVVALGEGPVLLRCEAESGNPQQLRRVRWYRDGKLVNETKEPDLLLEELRRSATGNYSCEAKNDAGWSPMSSHKSLVVMYPPGPAILVPESGAVPPLKGQRVTMRCHVNDTGLPPSVAFRWEHGGVPLNVTGATLVTEPVTTATQGNYSCAAVNQVGIGALAFWILDAQAPPSFLRSLPATGGSLRNATAVSLECVVECDPVCEVRWLRNNETLDESPFFHASQAVRPEGGGHFHSVASILSWNMSQLPPSSFDYNTFTCQSSENAVGPGVSSTMLFRVEYPPEKLQVSVVQLDLSEGEVPPREVSCSASAHPTAEYQWRLGALTVSRGPTLLFNATASREMAGNYTCVVSNRHGRAMAATLVTVRHRPQCAVVKEHDSSGNVVLRCEAQAVPPVVAYIWLRNNRTVQEHRGPRSTLVVPDRTSFGAYSCVASNAVGHSEPCQLKLTKLPSPAGWAQLLLKEENLIIMAGIAGGVVIIIVLLIVIISIVVIRKRIQSNTKPRLEERENAIGEIGHGSPQGKLSLLADMKRGGSPLFEEDYDSEDGHRSATRLVRRGTLELG